MIVLQNREIKRRHLKKNLQGKQLDLKWISQLESADRFLEIFKNI